MDNEKVTIDVERVRRDIEANIERLCRELSSSGKKIGHKWCTGDVSGSKGKSLKIELVAQGKKGLYHDWATGETGDFLKLIQARYGCGFREAVQKIGNVLGTDYFLPSDRDIKESKGTQKRGAAIDWSQHVEELKLCPDPLLVQVAKRKWTHEFCSHLLEHELLVVLAAIWLFHLCRAAPW
jgi:hypothetical protein